jgi:F0F1-type ATP synthase delta subunit
MAKVSRLKIAAALADKADRAGVSTASLSQEIAAYLLVSRRTSELDSLLRDVMEIRSTRGIVEVTAVTAHPLTAAVRADIEREARTYLLTAAGAPAASKIIISERLDESVVGGVRLELANQQLDLSVRAKLNRFKQLTTAGGSK